MTIQELTRSNIRRIADRITDELGELAEELGVDIQYGGGNFSPQNATLKLNVNLLSDTGNPITREQTDWEANAVLYGFRPEDLGREFNLPGTGMVKIAGLKTRNRKYPIIVERVSDGARYKLTPQRLSRLLEEQG